MHLSTNHVKLMSKIFYNYKNKVIQKCFYKVTLGQAINIFLVKINLKVMKINQVAVLWKKNFQIKKIIVSRFN